MPKLTENQKSSYRASVIETLLDNKGKKLDEIFKITIDKCNAVSWEDEEECSSIYDEILENSKEGVADKIFTKWFHLSDNV